MQSTCLDLVPSSRSQASCERSGYSRCVIIWRSRGVCWSPLIVKGRGRERRRECQWWRGPSPLVEGKASSCSSALTHEKHHHISVCLDMVTIIQQFDWGTAPMNPCSFHYVMGVSEYELLSQMSCVLTCLLHYTHTIVLMYKTSICFKAGVSVEHGIKSL